MSSGFQMSVTGVSAYKTHIKEQIEEAFKIFDEDGKGKIDIKYVEIIARGLGRTPRKAELRHFLKEVRDPESKEFVKLESLLPALTDILMKDKWKPVSQDVLLEAFAFFDTQKSGSLNPDYMRELLTQHADKFNEEEIEKFLAFAINPFNDTIDYAKCSENMAIPDIVDILEDKRNFLIKLQGGSLK